MTEILTAEGYEQTKAKLRDLETRLAEIDKRTDLGAEHLASVRRSYKMMMREFLQDIKLYEARHAQQNPLAQTCDQHQGSIHQSYVEPDVGPDRRGN